MYRRRLAAGLLVMTAASTAHAPAVLAQTALCQAVAQRLWSAVAVGTLHEQAPLAELIAAAPAAVTHGAPGLAEGDQPPGLAKGSQSIAESLIQDYAADASLTAKLHELPPTEATRFGETNVWLLDRTDGTLGCHSPMIVAASPGAAAHEIALPGSPDPTALCALSALTAVSIEGMPALWIEQSGAFSNSLGESTITIGGLREETFAPPCMVTVDYALSDQARHAFCDGVDCVPLIRTAEILALRLRQQETAESLGAGVIVSEADTTAYHRMAEIVAADQQAADLPAFGASLDTPYTIFADQVVFPVRLSDGVVYLVRMGHGGLGWRQTADTLVALYRLREDRLVPAASVYVAARRSGIIGVAVQ
jgi:hypothetical protein